MIEAHWQTMVALPGLVAYLKEEHRITRTKAGRRKLRLFACACCRLLAWHLPISARVRECVEAAERYAEDQGDAEELGRLLRTHFGTPESEEQGWAEKAMIETTRLNASEAYWGASFYIEKMLRAQRMTRPLGRIAEVFRHVFGNPFRPPLESAWLARNCRTVVGIAQKIHEERRFIDLPILADALEEAGCADAELLNHCREPGEHVLGCWVVDLMLGKDYRKSSSTPPT